jgi:NADH:ubiquinone oxidoreductase subunit K
MNASSAAFVALGVGIFAIFIAGALARKGVVAVILGLSGSLLGPAVAFAGIDTSGGGVLPPFGEEVALVLLAVGIASALLALSVAIVIDRHESVVELDDLDEIST